ncbi:dipeptide/oligopeptide/nickel ABC transporter ATP-binding protein [Desulfoscipio sp. XC116]|uniref:dipeptide/oligopeptide/nickel ABC transporter ATP-binding protein n=1 Tax=Desulfoscipio sp. XC116 TaxID=3144975 RepID=UPI00325B8AF0
MDGIQIERLNKKYSDHKGVMFSVLSDINFKISPGEFISVTGDSGTGKSTLARIVLGIEEPDSGKVVLDGRSVPELKPSEYRQFRSKIQAVFQDTRGTLNPKLSVYHNVEEALVNLTDLSRSERQKRIFELISLVGMNEKLLKVPTKQLSGGEQQRLSLLRALSVHPKYLVLDEVLSGLDLISQSSVLDLLEAYHKEHQFGCLFITHHKTGAYRLSDKVLVMKNGKIAREGVKQ